MIIFCLKLGNKLVVVNIDERFPYTQTKWLLVYTSGGVSERIVGIYNTTFERRCAGFYSRCTVAPCVIDIASYLRAVFIVYGNDISLEILLKVEGIEILVGICNIAVLNTHWRTVFVIQIYKQSISTRNYVLLANYLTSVEYIFNRSTALIEYVVTYPLPLLYNISSILSSVSYKYFKG